MYKSLFLLLILFVVFGIVSSESHDLLPLPSLSEAVVETQVASSSPPRAETRNVPEAAPSATPKQMPKPAQPSPETPSPAPEPTPAPPPTSNFATDVEQFAFALTNIERSKNDLPALVWNSELAAIARAHSADMLKNDYFSHEDAAGCSVACRADESGYAWRAIGENIYYSSGYTVSAQEEARMTVDGWMNSPGHRKNILGSFRESGVGVAMQGSTVYITAVYATPR